MTPLEFLFFFLLFNFICLSGVFYVSTATPKALWLVIWFESLVGLVALAWAKYFFGA